MEKNNSVEEFFKGLPEDGTDAFKEPESSEKEEEKKEEQKSSPEEGDDVPKNRHERRLVAKLQNEREANIALAEQVKILKETDRFYKDNAKEVDPRILKLFAPDETGKVGAQVLQELLDEREQRAIEKARNEMLREREEETKEQAQHEEFIESKLESLEDQFNIDLTSDSPKAKKARAEFLDVVERLSPKDESGAIKDFADFGGAYEVYRQSKTQVIDNSRNKEIASRTMQRGGTNTPPESKVFKTNNGFAEFRKMLADSQE